MSLSTLFTKFAKNIHYSTGTDEKDYPKLDKEFYELVSEIKEIEKPFNVSRKENQLQQIRWGMFYIGMNKKRTNIVKDVLEVLDKFKMPQLNYEMILGMALRTAIYTQDEKLMETVLKILPEKTCAYTKKIPYEALNYNLFLYYWAKGEKEKAEEYIKELAGQNTWKMEFTEAEDKHLNIPEKQKNEIREILEK
jgi:hypothetical protein